MAQRRVSRLSLGLGRPNLGRSISTPHDFGPRPALGLLLSRAPSSWAHKTSRNKGFGKKKQPATPQGVWVSFAHRLTSRFEENS